MRNSPQRVMFVSHDGSMYGAQQMLLTLLEGIDKSSIQPLLVVPADRELAARARGSDISVSIARLAHWAPGKWQLYGGGRVRYFLKVGLQVWSNVRALERLAISFDANAIVSNTATFVEGAIAAQRLRLPHIWHVHEPIYDNAELAPLLPSAAYKSVIKKLSAKVVFPSCYLRDYYGFGQNSEVVYNGLTFVTHYDRPLVRSRVRRQLGLEAARFLVGVVGALHPRKDHDNFLKMAKIVREQIDDVAFVIVGSGSAEQINSINSMIQALQISDCVTLYGRWAGEIADLMMALDVLVISSKQESFGLTSIEALSVETPVISTRCGGPEEIIRDGVTGYLVQQGDPVELAGALLRIIGDTGLAERFGRDGRADVLERFSRDCYVSGMQRVIDSSLSS